MATQRKKMLIMNILDILKKYTDVEHTLSQTEIRELLEKDYGMIVNRKAIKQNLMDLVDSGYRIEYTEKTRINKNGEEEILLTDWYLSRDFTDAELRLIVDSLLFSKHIPYNQCKELIGKVEGLSNQYFIKKVKHIRNLPENLPQNPELFLTIEVLDEAISHGRQVEFEYCEYGTDKKLHPRLNYKKAPKRYTVNPYQMVATNGRYYLIGNFDYFDNVGHYRIDRIKKIKLLDTPVKPSDKVAELKDGFYLPTHMAEHIYMFSGACGAVTFRAKKSIINDVIDWFGKDIRFFDETEEEVSVTTRVNYQAMKYWAMQYAAHIKVLSPPTLVEEVKKELTAAAEKYNNN